MNGGQQGGSAAQDLQAAMAHHQAGRFPEAKQLYFRVLQAEPRNSLALQLLGLLAHQTDRHDLAVDLIGQSLAIDPRSPEAWNNHGLSLFIVGRHAEALASCERALALRPDFPEALNNRGQALHALGRFEAALASFDEAIARQPRFAMALHNRAYTLEVLGRVEQAAESFRRALEIDPTNPEAPSRLLYCNLRLCDWNNLAERVLDVCRQVSWQNSSSVTPFGFLWLPGATPAEQRRCAVQFGAARCGRELSQPPLVAPQPRARQGRLRVGYLSPDFREHAVSYLLAEVIELHDRESFEVLGYSSSAPEDSAMRRRLESAFDKFRDIAPLTNAEAARTIAADGVDILVDLCGYTTGSRVEIPALRPAPVQAVWLGYPGTLGHPRLADYFIGDPVVSPLEHGDRYTEALALLPHCFQPNDRKRPVAERPSRAAAGLPESGFVFCCFNQSFKLTPEIFDIWCRLISAVPGSVLWLLGEEPAVQRNLRREAATRGVAPERLVFAPRIAYAAHLARLQLGDLFLDTLPFNAGATASDALWVGVPLVTCTGGTFAGRYAASLLHAAGLPELVTHSLPDYEALALALATDPERRSSLARKLKDARDRCLLFDSRTFTRDLERLYLRMWENQAAGRREPIVLEPGAS